MATNTLLAIEPANRQTDRPTIVNLYRETFTYRITTKLTMTQYDELISNFSTIIPVLVLNTKTSCDLLQLLTVSMLRYEVFFSGVELPLYPTVCLITSFILSRILNKLKLQDTRDVGQCRKIFTNRVLIVFSSPTSL